MLLIIAHHFVVNSGLKAAGGPIAASPLTWRSLFLLVFGAWGKTGINCFVLITGYFMCKSRITLKKFAKLLLEVMFYRLLITGIFWATGYQAFSVKSLILSLIPVSSVDTGFTNAFLVFFLTIPFLNALVHALDEKRHVYLLLLSGFLYVFLGTMPLFSVTMNYVSWFSVLFFIASYIRLYPKPLYESKKLWGWLALASTLLSVASVFVCTFIETKFGKLEPYYLLADSNKILAVVEAICLFMFFKNLKLGHNRVINSVAATTFGVFLIHTRGDAMRQWLWKDLVDCVGHYNDKLMPLYAIGCVLAVFVVCSCLDQIRIYLLEKPFFKLWDKKMPAIQEAWRRKRSRPATPSN